MLIAACVFVTLPTLKHSIALSRHTIGALAMPDSGDRLEALADIHVDELGMRFVREVPESRAFLEANDFDAVRIYRHPEQKLFQLENLHTLTRGVEAIRQAGATDKTIAVMDFANLLAFAA